MNDDQLRSRIAATDPVLDGADIDPVDSPSARFLLEAIMSTDQITTDADSSEQPESGNRVTWTEPKRRRWGTALLGAAAVAALAVAGAAIGGVFDRGDDAPAVADLPVDDGEPAPAEPVVYELSAGDADPAMMSCLQIDASIIAQSQVAFRGVVDRIDAGEGVETVTLAVDRWYAGGDADVVTIDAPLGLEALIGSIDFVVGEPYLISAWDGVVSYCGMSGAATPELQQMYDQAFPG